MKYQILEKLCKMQSGGTPSRSNIDFYDGKIPWAKISDLEKSNDGYIYKTEEHITEEALQSINNRFFKPGTLLLAMYGSVGKTAISKIELSTNQAILGINILDETKLDVSYLRYWFTTIKAQLLNRAVGAALANISLGIVKKLQIPLPPLEQQKKIASILDAADTLRQKDKALLAKYDELTQALFLDMFGDTWLNSKGFTLFKLSELVKNGKIITYGIVQAGEHITDGVPYIRTGDIKDGKIRTEKLLKTSKKIADSYERSKCATGDIIMSIRATVGTIALLPAVLNGANLTQGTARISIDESKAQPLYVFHAIKSKGIQLKIDEQTKGATFREITLTRLREIQIPLPPFKLQTQFAERVAIIEQQKAIAQASLEKSEELFNSLLQKAFKGELI